MEEVGYVMPTEVQKQALPHLFSGRDCILHAQVLFFSLISVVV
jgi:superfamily II DNA/RNA helicase